MPRFSLILNCLFVLALCLDGTAVAWQKSAMAIASLQHVHSHAADTRHANADHTMDSDAVHERLAMDCEEATNSDQSQTEDCTCSDGGCSCACDFIKLAVASTITPIDELWIGFSQVSHILKTIRPLASSSVFRPPIG